MQSVSTLRIVTTSALAVALLTGSMAIATANAEGESSGTPEQRQTIDDLRAVGRAMYDWYVAEMKPRATGRSKSASEIESETTRDLAHIPPISAAALERVLVPKYLAALPTRDGWGRPYEFRLATGDANADYVMAVRSAGSDGRFSADVYPIGAFADEAEDLVWSDGYFVRWPQPH